MKKKLRLKRFVLPMIYVILVFVFVMSTYAVFSARNDIPEEEINYVSNIIWSNDTPVVSTDKVLQKPYSNEKVTIGRYYYNYKDESKNQQNAIIFYEGSYMQNTGVDYILDEKFEVLSVFDGTITKVENNEMVGKTVEVKHSNNIISVYQGLSEVNVKEGDTVTQGTKIGTSGTSKVNNNLGNHLHFELYVDGQVVNPEDCFNKKLNELQA